MANEPSMKQGRQINSFFENLSREAVTTLINSGILSDLSKAPNFSKIDREKFREVIGLRVLPRAEQMRGKEELKEIILPFALWHYKKRGNILRRTGRFYDKGTKIHIGRPVIMRYEPSFGEKTALFVPYQFNEMRGFFKANGLLK
ncbi:MAG: hypothetical protein JW740_02480 [Candidatus Zambryskibacteria bacterium]|nr:hypothetical protein [Candidatus Zambryskibacteria bacterium]